MRKSRAGLRRSRRGSAARFSSSTSPTTSSSRRAPSSPVSIPREYQVALDRAAAELADAEANALAAGAGVPIASVSTLSDLRTAEGGVDEAQAGIAVAERQVDAAKAQLLVAEARARERRPPPAGPRAMSSG